MRGSAVRAPHSILAAPPLVLLRGGTRTACPASGKRSLAVSTSRRANRCPAPHMGAARRFGRCWQLIAARMTSTRSSAWAIQATSPRRHARATERLCGAAPGATFPCQVLLRLPVSCSTLIAQRSRSGSLSAVTSTASGLQLQRPGAAQLGGRARCCKVAAPCTSQNAHRAPLPAPGVLGCEKFLDKDGAPQEYGFGAIGTACLALCCATERIPIDRHWQAAWLNNSAARPFGCCVRSLCTRIPRLPWTRPSTCAAMRGRRCSRCD